MILINIILPLMSGVFGMFVTYRYLQKVYTDNLKQAYEKAKNEITSQVAHDIRSPLAAINTAVLVLKTSSEQEKSLIFNATKRIGDIADGLR